MISLFFRKKNSVEETQKKLAYSCFVDSNFKFYKEVFRFIWSLERFQKVAYSDIFVTCSSCCDPSFLAKLREFEGLNISLRDRMTAVSPPANKWLQLDAIPVEDFTHVTVNDCDKLYVAFDEQRWCNGNVRAAQFVPRPTFSVFEEIFSQYGLGKPSFYVAKPDPKDVSQDDRAYINNHNGGLLIIPTSKLEQVKESWLRWIDRLLENLEILGANHRNLDQVAFSLALHDNDLEIDFIPKSLDLGMGVSHFQEKWLKKEELILHIHGDDDSYGFVRPKPAASKRLIELCEQLNSEYMVWAEQKEIFTCLDQIR
ncbi:hypothetical protein KUV95_11860 [Microbulbifer agarilyticus]|uniref:hypothetical protein n=1 Tax=Microbulbifer agarilyticus TaxID=260552 RepID=UPI001C968F64|nr:hypothetical protein [Microbulbifer agarilyticus]MBY6212247.1 hypothetical protein [Microbulbifer agarilyticus]